MFCDEELCSGVRKQDSLSLEGTVSEQWNSGEILMPVKTLFGIIVHFASVCVGLSCL